MGLDFGTYFYLKNYTILIGWMNTTGQMRSLIEHNHVISGTPLEHGIEALEHIFGISCQVIADFNFYEFYKIQKYVSIQQLVARVEFSSDDTNIPEIIDENQNQNLTNESDNNTEFADENETTNPLSMNFPDLQYILNQKSVPQNQFENFDQLFTLEGFLCPKILINIRKNHDAFSQHSKKTNHEFTNNSIQENHVNRRKDRWEGCKRLATIPIASGTNSKYLLLAL
ncbi:6119_t:CDS:2 [Rhizophagus irregularis]|nr:6119_t:CDS:2 [Rhizophagus irregularis]